MAIFGGVSTLSSRGLCIKSSIALRSFADLLSTDCLVVAVGATLGMLPQGDATDKRIT